MIASDGEVTSVLISTSYVSIASPFTLAPASLPSGAHLHLKQNLGAAL
jgi:hypothetical protein